MSRGSRIAAEIMNGGPEIVSETLEHLALMDGWQTDEPPEDPNAEIIVRHLPLYKWVPYESEQICKARKATGRWMRQDEDGTWRTAKLPTYTTWRLK